MQDPTMERYPGEHDSLSRFLIGLEPAIAEVVGDHHLLLHAVKRALRRRKLVHLRHARDIFNALPKRIRDELSSQLIESSDHLDELIDHEDEEDTTSIIRFETSQESPSVQVTRQRSPHVPGDPLPSDIAVDIQSGTLPSIAAAKLRLIACRIETDKTVLSSRRWQGRDPGDQHKAGTLSERARFEQD